MLAANQKDFMKLFNELLDPRMDEKLTYPLEEILFLVLAAVLSGAESWRKIILYGNKKLKLLRKFLPFKDGLPSRHTLMTVFGLLDKKHLERWLLSWTSDYLENLENELIAIDGKALKGASKGSKRSRSLYLLNAFATGQGLVIGHKAIEEKTNEITAIPILLDSLSVKNSVVSIDAIGCQKNIAEQIINKEADYFLALKANQKHLFDDVVTFFESAITTGKKLSYNETLDKGHGRLEIRRCWSTDEIKWLVARNPGWKNLTSICVVESERHIKGSVTRERRYYITSYASDAKQLLSYSRRHWAIENNLHWVLDVGLNEDGAQFRADNAAENMGVIRKVVINLIKRYKKKRQDLTAISSLRMAAGWDDKTALGILKGLVC